MYNPKARHGHQALNHIDLRLAPVDSSFRRAEEVKTSLAYALAGIACAAPFIFAIIVWSI